MQRKLVTAATVLLACGLVFGAVRYSRRSPSIPTIEVKRTEFLDSVQFRGECTALKSLSITAPADAGDLQILKIATDGAKPRAIPFHLEVLDGRHRANSCTVPHHRGAGPYRGLEGPL